MRDEGSMKDSDFGGREVKVGKILIKGSNFVTECSKPILAPVNNR